MFLILHGRFPSEKAAALFAAKSAASFADQGLSVTLLVPRRLKRVRESAFDFYGIKNNFRIIFLPTIDLFRMPLLRRVAFPVSFLTFSLCSIFYSLFSIRRHDIIYSNESLPLLCATLFFPHTVYEIHDFPKQSILYRTLFSRVSKCISTNEWKKQKICETFSVPAERILVERNAVSLEDFQTDISTSEARARLNFPHGARLITYVGMLRTMGMEKGISVALEALRALPHDATLLFVGGSSDDIAFYHTRAETLGVSGRVIFTGFVPHKDVPLYLTASDVLIAPFPKAPHYEFFMSPMKLFEYMASGRPIVASDLPSIREITGAENALLVPPDDPAALAGGISKILNDKDAASRYASAALRTVSEHTWQKRARRILTFLQ